MFLPAKAFLPPGVADQQVGRFHYIERLPEADYIATVKEALLEQGVAYVHMSYWMEQLKTPSGWSSRRVYYVKSFVWQGQVFIIRGGTFKESDFCDWPAHLQMIWQETGIAVPNHGTTISLDN